MSTEFYPTRHILLDEFLTKLGQTEGITLVYRTPDWKPEDIWWRRYVVSFEGETVVAFVGSITNIVPFERFGHTTYRTLQKLANALDVDLVAEHCEGFILHGNTSEDRHPSWSDVPVEKANALWNLAVKLYPERFGDA